MECNLFDKSYDTKGKLYRKKPRGSIAVAEDGGKIIGCVFYTWDGWDSSIYRLAIAKKYRNMRIGTKLLEEAEKRLKRKGADVSSLRIHIKNKKAIEFFRKHGYYGRWGPYWDLEKKL
jgi:ribosomal protein S18 acetylase RimI-like enzyme